MEQVAHAQQRNRSQPRYRAGANHATEGGGGVTMLGQLLFHKEASERSHKAVIAPEILRLFWRGGCEANAPLSAFSYR